MPSKRLFGYLYFHFSFTIFLRHVHCNQVYCATYGLRVWLRWREKDIHMFTTISTQVGLREIARKRHDHLNASVLTRLFYLLILQ